MASIRAQHGGAIRVNKTCDQCRHRKIRCIVDDSQPGSSPTCTYCAKRGQLCHFSIFRPKARSRGVWPRVADPASISASSQASEKVALDEFYIDRVLQHGPQNITLPDETTIFTVADETVPSSGLAFFSEQKVASLTRMIGNSRIEGVIKRLDNFILKRLGIIGDSRWIPVNFNKPTNMKPVTPEEASLYIDAYFINLHPVYPFLDRDEFEAQASDPAFIESLPHDPVASALYHAILALGSQYVQGGSFEPGKGRSWELFQVSLSHLGELILPRASVESVQALAAMSILAMNCCALPVDDYIISHAARSVIILRYHKSVNFETKHLRLFWVIYALEKQIAMHSRTCSIIPDEDIGCVVPPFPEAQYNDFNWFVAFIRIARITSIVCTSLFSISASLRSAELHQSTIDHIHGMLENWRQSIPEEFRPGDSAHFPGSASASVRMAAFQLHFSYYHIIIALERLTLYLDRKGGARLQKSKQSLMNTARTIIELTKHIDIQSYVPVFIIAVLPTSATFILFDLVIHNPSHRESRTNLSSLDTAAGFFTLVDIASNQSLPGTIMPEFALIAREYLIKVQQEKASDKATVSRPTGTAAPKDRPLPAPSSPEQDMGMPGLYAADANMAMGTLVPPITDIDVQDATVETASVTPTGSDYLNYPDPLGFETASDFQMGDSVDLRAMFGWALPEWYATEGVGGMDMDSMIYQPSQEFDQGPM